MLRPRRPIGQSDDLHALAPEDLVEAGCELGVPIAEQEAGLDLAILEEPCQLTGLLDHPGPGGRGCAAREVDAAAADLQEEEDVKAREPDRLHGEEVDRQHLLGVLTDELAPGALAAAWGRQESVLPQDVAHGAVRQAAAELQEFRLGFGGIPTSGSRGRTEGSAPGARGSGRVARVVVAERRAPTSSGPAPGASAATYPG
jgi:hypothetical protein